MPDPLNKPGLLEPDPWTDVAEARRQRGKLVGSWVLGLVRRLVMAVATYRADRRIALR